MTTPCQLSESINSRAEPALIKDPPRLLWLSVNCSYSHTSLALPLLHASSQNNPDLEQWQWQHVACTINEDVFHVAARIAKEGPTVVAATVYLFNREVLLQILDRVKTLRPACRVVLGGPEFLGRNQTFLASPECPADAILRGEGEDHFAQFLKYLETPGKWPEIPGLCWLDEQGRYNDNNMAITQVESLDQIPSPMASRFYDTSRPFATIETARGCFANCAYCTSAAEGAVRTLSIQRVREILTDLRAQGVDEVRVLDRTFNRDSQRCGRLLKCFAEEFPELRFHLEIHPAFLSAQVRKGLTSSPSGQLHLEAGWQTGLTESLRQIRRPGTPKQAREGLAFLCNQPNLETHVDILAGLPGADYRQTLTDLEEIMDIGPNEIQLELLKLLPGTELRERAAEFGLLHAPDPPYEILKTPHIKIEELEEIRQISKLIDKFYNQPQLRPAIREAVKIKGGDFLPLLLEQLRGTAANYQPGSLTNRYHCFHKFIAEQPELACVRQILEYQWLLNGHSPQHGICQAHLWKSTIPGSARLVEGEEQANSTSARIWQTRIGDCDYWFVFANARKKRTAAAIYRAP